MPKLFTTILFGCLCLVLTVYILLSSVEIAFGYDFTFIGSLTRSTMTPTITSLAQDTGSKVQTSFVSQGAQDGDAGLVFSDLVIPKISGQLGLTKSIYLRDEWYFRPAQGHYLFLTDEKTQTLETIIVYYQESWRSLSHADALYAGDNIYLVTDSGNRYHFKLDERYVVRAGYRFVPADRQALQLVVLSQTGQGLMRIWSSSLVATGESLE